MGGLAGPAGEGGEGGGVIFLGLMNLGLSVLNFYLWNKGYGRICLIPCVVCGVAGVAVIRPWMKK